MSLAKQYLTGKLTEAKIEESNLPKKLEMIFSKLSSKNAKTQLSVKSKMLDALIAKVAELPNGPMLLKKYADEMVEVVKAKPESSSQESEDYIKEIEDRTGWSRKEVLRVLQGLKDKSFAPADHDYYLKKISPF